ncbi:MAG: hypothetical protein COA84_03435 [Robiginitomaculum sp.]|nr:MAG: hypothetical protein COA84_03435 [Robiginitomaculum sp.]
MPLVDAIATDNPSHNEAGKTRTILARRLADIVCLPSSRITPVERHMSGDLLVGILAQSPLELRQRCARRVAPLMDVAPGLMRFLIRDEISVARLVLEASEALSDLQLVEAARATTPEHRQIIARRRGLSELVCEALLAPGEPEVTAKVLRNRSAILSQDGLDRALELSRTHPALCTDLLKRPELRPSQGLTLFWWASPKERSRVLIRFAVGRDIMQDAAGDIFSMMAEEDWQDPLVRKAMQFIERRQRNRAAIDKSPYSSLENAIDSALEVGIDAALAEEISYLSGIKPVSGAQILSDINGEPIAVLCKATGLKRDYLIKLWRALKRPMGTEVALDPTLERTIACFDSLSSNKAQTVLRYWNWALSADLTAEHQAEIRAPGHMHLSQDMTTPERTAALVYGQWGDPDTSAI